jgi:hypothetical protein
MRVRRGILRRWLVQSVAVFALCALSALWLGTLSSASATSGAHARAAKKKSCTELKRHRESLERQLTANEHAPGGGSKHRQEELKHEIKHLDGELKKDHCKTHVTPPPAPPPPPAATKSCSGTLTADPVEAEEEDYYDPCTNAPGKIAKFTMSSDKGPITNVIAPPGFTCNVPPAQPGGVMTCAAATPVDPATTLKGKLQVGGGVQRCPMTVTVTDTFTDNSSFTFKISC